MSRGCDGCPADIAGAHEVGARAARRQCSTEKADARAGCIRRIQDQRLRVRGVLFDASPGRETHTGVGCGNRRLSAQTKGRRDLGSLEGNTVPHWVTVHPVARNSDEPPCACLAHDLGLEGCVRLSGSRGLTVVHARQGPSSQAGRRDAWQMAITALDTFRQSGLELGRRAKRGGSLPLHQAMRVEGPFRSPWWRCGKCVRAWTGACRAQAGFRRRVRQTNVGPDPSR